MMFKIDGESLFREIKKRRIGKVVLQMPEGLKSHAVDLALFLEARGVNVTIYAEPCFGACDLYEGEGLLIHFGHSPIYGSRTPTLFYEVEDDYDFIPALSGTSSRLPKKLGLLTTVQHVKTIPKVKEFLEGRGYSVYIGKGKGRIRYPGQVLGCNFSAAKSVEKKVDAFLFLGSGMFHPIGVALATNKPVFRCYETIEEVTSEKESILKQRYGEIFRAGDGEKFGILTSKKGGQRRRKDASKIKGMFERAGKKALIVEMDALSEDKVASMGFDAFVMCACPRIAIDDSSLWKKPVLTVHEAEILLGKRKGYVLDEIP
jgi:2-(3-amino-3-carboxypropyl)histidine synthase